MIFRATTSATAARSARPGRPEALTMRIPLTRAVCAGLATALRPHPGSVAGHHTDKLVLIAKERAA